MAVTHKTSGGWRGEGMGEGMDLYTLLVKGKWRQPLWKSVRGFSEKARIAPPFVPAVKLLGICSKDSITCRGYPWTFVCISALATIARKWKQPRRSSTDEWIIKKCDIFTQGSFIRLRESWNYDNYKTMVRLKIMTLSATTRAKGAKHMLPLIHRFWDPVITCLYLRGNKCG